MRKLALAFILTLLFPFSALSADWVPAQTNCASTRGAIITAIKNSGATVQNQFQHGTGSSDLAVCFRINGVYHWYDIQPRGSSFCVVAKRNVGTTLDDIGGQKICKNPIP